MVQIAKKIDISDIEEGDTVTAVSGNYLYTEVKVVDVADDGSFYSDCRGFDPDWGWKNYLIERPKRPLPTKLGSVVEIAGTKWVLCDPEDMLQWRSLDNGWKSSEDLAEKDWVEVE